MANERTGPVQAPRGAAAERQQQEQALARTQHKNLSEMILRHRDDFMRVIPRHLDGMRIIRVALSALARDQKLLACTEQSVIRGVMQSATLGLEIGVLGEAYLVPFRDNKNNRTEATFIPGYQGLIKLAIQSKAVASIQVGAVYPGEEFDYGLGSAPFVKHKPNLKLKNPQALIAAYAVCKLMSGEFQATIMGKEEIDSIRARSRAKDSGPWVTDYEAMAIKTVIRRALKYVPKTPLLTRGIEQEERAEMGVPNDDLFTELEGVKLPGEEVQGEGRQVPNDSVSAAAEALGAKPSDVDGLNAEHDRTQGREPGSDG